MYGIALRGDLLVLGELSATPAPLAVRIFREDAGGPGAWGLEATIEPNNGQPFSGVFGSALSLSGDLLAINRQPGGLSTGSMVELWQRQGAGVWSLVKMLLPPAGVDAGGFGTSIALDGQTIAIGAIGITPESRSVSLFRRPALNSNDWLHLQDLRPALGDTDSRYGACVSLWFDLLAVSASRTGSDGLIYTYRELVAGGGSVAWQEAGQITSPMLPQAGGSGFGHHLALVGGALVTASPEHSNNAANLDGGRLFTFEFNRSARQWQRRLNQSSPATPAATARAGFAVAKDAGFLVIGAPFDDRFGAGAGAAYVYARDADGQWGLEAELNATPANATEGFGYAVAIDAGTIVIGAPYAEVGGIENAGAAYVFHRREIGGVIEWEQVQKLNSPVVGALDVFGLSVAVSGSLLAVGSPNTDILNNNSVGVTDAGIVALYARNGTGFDYQGTLLDGSTTIDGAFGTAVAMDAGRLVVGSPRKIKPGFLPANQPPVEFAGAAFVYARDAGTGVSQAHVLYSEFPAPNNGFGSAVAVRGAVIAIGEPGSDRAGPLDSGAAGVAEIVDGLIQRRYAIEPVPTAAARFGHAVALDDGIAYIGAPYTEPDGIDTDAGAVYRLQRGDGFPAGWTLDPSPRLQDRGYVGALYGHAVAADDGELVVGAPWLSPLLETYAGVAYVYGTAVRPPEMFRDGFE